MKIQTAFILSAILISAGDATAQYAGPVGTAGTGAIHKDSSIFTSWATSCEVIRGYQDISDPSLGYASAGDSTMATGIAGSNGVVSLGDGGMATCTFGVFITNGPGWDFAVFENSFGDEFLELGFVEVSSDGFNFHRFPAHSLTDTSAQVDSFDSLDASQINNLAGKYRVMYGTPFDLSELSHILSLDVDHITHVRVIDVVGSIAEIYSTYDTAGRKVNDPWPTPFPTGGFDLDAIGVIHSLPLGMNEKSASRLSVFPNPSAPGSTIFIQVSSHQNTEVFISDASGKKIEFNIKDGRIELNGLNSGLYFITIRNGESTYYSKLIIL
jgi:hypothetical protein